MSSNMDFCISSPEEQSQYRYIRKDLLWELANAIMEAVTCHHVPSAAGEQGKLVV